MCNRRTGDVGPGFRRPPSGRMLGFIQPWLLLLLSEKSVHGYELLDKLNQNEDTRGVDPGFLYRTLRQFEQDGIVKSSWDIVARGPARRVYEITPEGVEYLHAWVDRIRGTRERLCRFMEAYESYSKSQTAKERR